MILSWWLIWIFLCFSDAPIRSHLKSVYACLAMTIMSATAGAYTHLFTNLLRGGGIFYALLSMGLVMGLLATPDNGKNRSTRIGLLLAFAFFTGLGTGPLLDMAIRINPSIIPNAFMMSGKYWIFTYSWVSILIASSCRKKITFLD